MNNLLSLALGLAAWALPIIALFLRKRQPILYCGSLAACTLSLLFQLREVMRLVNKPDWAAVEDTIHAVNFCAATLVIVALTLNVVVLLRREQ